MMSMPACSCFTDLANSCMLPLVRIKVSKHQNIEELHFFKGSCEFLDYLAFGPGRLFLDQTWSQSALLRFATTALVQQRLS